MKKKLTLSMVLVIALLFIVVTALAVALLSPKEIVEQVAVPVAQNNNHENYTYEELADLIRTLNENGITMDESSRIMKAFRAGRGYWEEDTIREICRAAFGNEEFWTREQQYWYGEMLVASGVWKENAYILPREGELHEEEARKLAVRILKDTYQVDLPAESDKSWTVSSSLGLISDERTEEGIPSWLIRIIPSDQPDSDEVHGYIVTFDLHGENAKSDNLIIIGRKTDDRSAEQKRRIQTAAKKMEDAISEYGEIMYFWPDEVKVEVYGATGLPYAIPEQAEIGQALEDTKRFICEKYGPDALEKLGDYKVGYLFQRLDDEEDTETKMLQLMWDIVFTTDPEYLSDGYRVQFQRVIYHETGEEEITDLNVDHAHLGSG